MSHAAVDQDETEDRYHTQIEAGDVRLFTLDQLDAAFNAGLIHENTYVCLEGGSDWLTLGEVAGLGDEEPESAPVPAAVSVPQSRPLTAAPSYAGYAAAPSVIPTAPYSVAPMVMPRSIAPVTNDLSFDDDLDMMAMRPKRRAGKIVAGLAVLALGGLGFMVVQSGGLKLPKLLNLDQNAGQASAASLTLSSLKDTQAAPTPPAPPPVAEAAKPEPPKAEEPKAADAAPAADATKTDADSSAKKSTDRFSEEMKAALLNKDKQQVDTQKHKKATRTAVAAKHAKPTKSGKSSSGFKTGGSAYDPLNGKL